MGANCTIVGGVNIGKFAFIGVGSVITKDVKPYRWIVDVPAKHVGWMSEYVEKLNLRLQGIETTTCQNTGKKYQLFK